MIRYRLASVCASAAALALLAASATAQASVDLGKRNARSKYTLGQLFSVQELPDGRVVASDTKEQVFRLVDLAKGDVGLVGKQGDDPDNYRAASLIFRLPGDSLALFDPVGRKLLHVTPQGIVATVVPLPSPQLPNKRRLGTLVGIDANDALYFTIGEQFDTVTKALSGVANVTRVQSGAALDEPQLTYRTRRADQTRPSGIMPYFYRDAIAVRSDGLVARVVADTYQVVWSRNGNETGHTGPLAYTPIAISPAEQQAIKDSTIEQMKARMAGARGAAQPGSGAAGNSTFSSDGAGQKMIIMSGGGGGGSAPMVVTSGSGGFAAGFAAGVAGASGGAPGDTKVMTPGVFDPAGMPLGTFPEFKPPIVSTGVVALFDNSGNLWVARERVHGDQVPHYDVIAEGKGVIGHVNLPAGTRLVGFGRNAVYLARAEDGSDWLERYAMPKM